MRLEQLEYLAAVVQHGSLRRASEHLHISQPALSEGVGKLERELGVTLLDRHRSGARINRSGRELLAHMTEVLEAVDRLRAAAGDQNGVTRTVRVGTVNTGTSSVVAPAVLAFQRGRRSTTVEVVDLTHPGVVDGVLEGSLDLGLVNLLSGDELPAELEHHDPGARRPGRGDAARPCLGRPGDGHGRRAARGALRGDAPGLRHAPLRAAAVRRPAAGHDLPHRRLRAWASCWSPTGWASRCCPTSASSTTRSAAPGCSCTGRSPATAPRSPWPWCSAVRSACPSRSASSATPSYDAARPTGTGSRAVRFLTGSDPSRWERSVSRSGRPCVNHLSWLEAAVVGLLQGVTELFPISSLGHSVLLPAVLGGSWARDLDVAAPESPYLAFIVGTHVATALALLVFYRRDWLRLTPRPAPASGTAASPPPTSG